MLMDVQPEPTPPWRGGHAAEGGFADTIKSILGALRRRWRMAAAIALAIFAVVVVGVLSITPRYQAITRIKIDQSQGAALGQINQSNSAPDQAIVDTEVSVMRSRDLAERVVRKLDLIADPEFAGDAPPPKTPEQRERRIAAVAGSLLGAISVERERATYIIEIGVTSLDPAKAALIANTVADQYMESSVGRRTGTAERQAEYLEKRLKALSAESEAADARLAEFRGRTGTVEAGTTVTDQQISPLAGQLATAESEAAAAASAVASARRQIANGGLNSVSAVLNSRVIADLRAQRAQLVTSQGMIETRYGPKHPETIKIREQIGAIDQQITDEANRVVSGLQSDAGSAAARAASLRGDLAQLRGKQSQEVQSSVLATGLQRRAEAAQNAYNQLATVAQQTEQVARNSMSQAQVVEAATPPRSPSKPNRKLLFAAGLLAALICGFGAVAVSELMTVGLRTSADVERLGLPFIASVPRMSGRQLKDGEGPASPADRLVTHPMTSYAEAFRVIRSALTLSTDEPVRVIAVASVLPGEGKTTSALSLARMMAISGERTLVIDSDLRRAGLSRAVGASKGDNPGLVEVLRDGIDPRQAIVPDRVEKLDVLPLADASFISADLFSGTALRDLIAQLQGEYDRIIFDTPPLLGVADARTIAAAADGVVLVVKWESTPRSALKSGLAWLDADNARVAGGVLSMVDPSAEAVGALYYSQQYAKYYSQ